MAGKRIPNLTPFTHASMGMQGTQDRPYSGSLNPIWCERELAIERDLTTGEYVQNHIGNWNFNNHFDHLYNDRFQHELGHVLLGLAFLKMGRNPTQFDFGYDGNNQAEALVIAMEKPFENMLDDIFSIPTFRHFSEDEYVQEVGRLFETQRSFTNGVERMAHVKVSSLPDKEGLVSIFEYRRRGSFDETNGQVRDFNHAMHAGVLLSKLTQKNGEKFETINAPMEEDVREIYQIVAPVIRAIARALEQDDAVRSADFMSQINEVMNAFKSFYVSDLWHVMNNPDSSVELRLKERKSFFQQVYDSIVNK